MLFILLAISREVSPFSKNKVMEVGNSIVGLVSNK
jgi:hypothetical protein